MCRKSCDGCGPASQPNRQPAEGVAIHYYVSRMSMGKKYIRITYYSACFLPVCLSVSRPAFPPVCCCCWRRSSTILPSIQGQKLFATQLLALLDTKHGMCLLGKAVAENQLQFRLSTLIESYTALVVIVVDVVAVKG